MQATKCPSTNCPPQNCPPRNRLKDYLAGKLDLENSELLERHLLECSECEQTASDIDREPDTLVELLQFGSVPVGPAQDGQRATASESANRELSHSLPAIPTVIASYELIRQLGGGGMGAVYLARHKKLDKQVAIKLLPALPARLPEFVARFQREMRAAGQLEHPAIVRSTDAGEENGIHFLVMDAIDGLDLSRIAHAQHQLPIADACEVVRQAALGLSYSHEKGIVHRDIKPSNLMLNVDGQVKILDFGLAQVGLWDSGSAEITTVGQLMGTLDYMAPEQAERGGAVDYRADLYSLGATLFRLLTGRPPLAAAPDLTPLEKLRLLATHKAPKLATLRSDVPLELSMLLDSFLSREPASRPASAAHAAELLEPYCNGAELQSLLARARTNTDALPENRPAHAALLCHGIHSQLAPTNADLSPSSRGSNQARRWTWLSVALCVGMAYAGILLVLETSKGQLVIESDSADVQVKLVKDGGEASELHIAPGTQTTRLRSGKYEIIIDSPSDNFRVSQNQEFTIRNGETIVAKVTTNKIPNSTPSPQQIVSALGSKVPQDERLETVVYDGYSLDVWLRRLKFERSSNKIKEALSAISAMSGEEVSDLIEPAMLDYLLNPKAMGSHYPQAVALLGQASGERFFDNLTKVLIALRSDQERSRSLLQAAYQLAVVRNVPRVAQLQSFLEWSRDLLADDSMSSQYLSHLLKAMLEDSGSTRVFPSECQQAVLDVLTSSKRLSDGDFWLISNEGAYDKGPWHAPLRDEIVRRAINVLADDQANPQLVAQAGLVLASTRNFSSAISDEQKLALIEALQTRFAEATRNPELALQAVAVSGAFSSTARPIVLDKTKSTSDSVVNQTMVLMNIVDVFQWRTELQASITALHESLATLALYGNEFVNGNGSDQPWQRTLSFLGSSSKEKLLLQTAYVQSGLLIRKDLNHLVARFSKKLPEDIAVDVGHHMDRIEFDNNRGGLSALHHHLTRDCAERAIPLLTDQLIQFGDDTSGLVTAMLWRVTGDQFFEHFTKALESTSPAKRSTLLATDFSTLREFGCSKPESLAKLLTWSDAVFASDSASDIDLQFTVARMLRTLLRDRSAVVESQKSSRQDFEAEGGLVSQECQREILSHLLKYPQLTDQNFWLAEPVSYAQPLDKAFRDVMLQRAFAVLSTSVQPAADLTQSRTHALMVLRSVVHQGDQLSPVQSEGIKRYLSMLLINAAKNLDGTMIELQTPFWTWALPRNLGGTFGDFSGPGNELIVALSLIDELDLAQELTAVLRAVYDAAEKVRITQSYFINSDTTWGQRIRDAKRRNTQDELVVQTVFILAGRLLGEDYQELVRRPEQVAREIAEARLRFVRPGDTLAITIPSILPADGSPPPVIQAGQSSPVTGFPVPVNAEGEILVPHLEPLSVQGKELKQVRDELINVYVSLGILKRALASSINVQFLMHAGEEVELRNVSGQGLPIVPQKN